MTTDRLPQPGDSFDVFVVSGRRAGKLTGYLCKATTLWNGTSQLLPYSRTVTGFTVRTDSLRFGVKFAGQQVHYYTSARAS